MLKTWTSHDPSPAPPDFASELAVSPLVASLLWQRGYRTAESARRFLDPVLDDLEDPFAYLDMPKAVERIRRAIAKNEHILIYGDYDVDGITGSAILFRILREKGARVDAYIPNRMRDGYGMKRAALEGALSKDTALVIAVDNGIAASPEIEFLASKKIDAIVVDHHVPQGPLPAAAVAVVSAERREGAGESPLAACGLAFKLGWALEESLDAVKRHLDLVALGTIADLAPLTGENRVLARYGLDELAVTSKKGLAALLGLLQLNGRRLSSENVAFGIAPRLNAAGRMGSAEDAFALLVTESGVEAENLVRILDQSNTQRRKVERDAFREALEQVETGHHFGRDRVIVVASDRWHEGIAGILAARLVERFHRPSFVIAVREGFGKGSGRSIPNFLLFQSLERCAGLFESFGGHHFACGLHIREERIAEFRAQINRVAQDLIAPESLAAHIEIDAEAELAALDPGVFADLARFEPCGAGNPAPVFLTRGLRVKSECRSAGKYGSTFWLEDSEGRAMAEATAFRQKFDFTAGTILDVVYRPAFSEWRGIPALELAVEDVRVIRAGGAEESA